MVGVGCGGLALLVAAVAGFMIYRSVQAIKTGTENPEEAIRKVLKADTLPPGYHANIAFSIPFFMDFAMLSTEPNTEEERGPKSLDDGFFYTMIRWSSGNDRQKLRDYFEGKTDDASVLKDSNINVNTGEIIKRGSFEAQGQSFMYATVRGEFNTQHGGVGGDSMMTLLLVECPSDKYMRFAMRFGPDPDPAAPVSEIDLTGTIGDVENLTAFLSHFTFCPQK